MDLIQKAKDHLATQYIARNPGAPEAAVEENARVSTLGYAIEVLAEDGLASVVCEALLAEARALGLEGSVEYPGYLALTDACNRILHIGYANGCWEVDVFAPNTDGSEWGDAADKLDGDTPIQLINHALAIANRVAC